jgi:hypothetical protein
MGRLRVTSEPLRSVSDFFDWAFGLSPSFLFFALRQISLSSCSSSFELRLYVRVWVAAAAVRPCVRIWVVPRWPPAFSVAVFFFPLVLSPLFFSMIFLALVADEIGACYVEI